jgi:hypothetical protein
MAKPHILDLTHDVLEIHFVQLFLPSLFLSPPYSQCTYSSEKLVCFSVSTWLQMGLWVNAALHYCENYIATEDIFKGFDSSKLSSIRIVKEPSSRTLSRNLAYITSNFGAVSSTTTRLDVVGAQMHDSLKLVQGNEHQIWYAHTKVAVQTIHCYQQLHHSCYSEQLGPEIYTEVFSSAPYDL